MAMLYLSNKGKSNSPGGQNKKIYPTIPKDEKAILEADCALLEKATGIKFFLDKEFKICSSKPLDKLPNEQYMALMALADEELIACMTGSPTMPATQGYKGEYMLVTVSDREVLEAKVNGMSDVAAKKNGSRIEEVQLEGKVGAEPSKTKA